MGEALRTGFAAILILLGVSALAGWAAAFRNRLYLACIGVAFVALGGGLLIRSETVTAGQVLLWCLAAVTFLAGLALAVCDVRREMAAIQEQRRGLEREMEAYLDRLRAEHGETGEESPSQAAGPPSAREGGADSAAERNDSS